MHGLKKLLIVIPEIAIVSILIVFLLGAQKQETKARDMAVDSEQTDVLETLSARIDLHGVELKLDGCYSSAAGSWCIALPAGCEDSEVFLEAKTSKGGVESFTRIPGEDTVIFTWEDTYYPIRFLCADNIETLYVTLNNKKTLNDIHENKTEEIPGIMTIIGTDGSIDYAQLKGFYGHGNDSWSVEKKSYNMKFESCVDLLGMGENEDFVLLAGYRDNSLMSYVTTAELVREIGFEYASEFRLVNLYVAGEYAGVYFLTEKIEIDKNRIEISSVYEQTKEVNQKRLDSFEYQGWADEEKLAKRYYYNVEKNPEDITGGYLLELDVADYEEDDSRFVSKRRIKLTMKRARYSSEEQVNYMWQFWTDFENALFAEDGFNEKGKHYSEYIDMESFAMQWLMYEVEQEASMLSSVYFYKESDISGDGLLHACFPWDMEHSYLMNDTLDEFVLPKEDALNGYWSMFYQHEDFRQEVSKVWEEKFVPAIEKMAAEEPLQCENGLSNLSWYQNNVIEAHTLENSRWETQYLWNRCGEIKEILCIRLQTLSEAIK